MSIALKKIQDALTSQFVILAGLPEVRIVLPQVPAEVVRQVAIEIPAAEIAVGRERDPLPRVAPSPAAARHLEVAGSSPREANPRVVSLLVLALVASVVEAPVRKSFATISSVVSALGGLAVGIPTAKRTLRNLRPSLVLGLLLPLRGLCNRQAQLRNDHAITVLRVLAHMGTSVFFFMIPLPACTGNRLRPLQVRQVQMMRQIAPHPLVQRIFPRGVPQPSGTLNYA
jgi:hypothetical protein